MSEDLPPTQAQGDEVCHARERSLRPGLPPALVPGYDIQRCLGQGAYGEVWVATDVNNPGRHVAIKFYTRGAGDWGLLAREVEKLNFLATDRYVVQLIDVGWNADPPYYVMEYLEKGSLAERVDAGPLSVSEAVALFREIVVGVVHAHNRGVLHCDLKPANVLLGPDDKPRLADFGQSRLSNEETGALGTLFYMAPEQADLKAAPDARWDVYGLGAILYCLLTGQPPYRDAPGSTTVSEGGPLDERLGRYRRLLQESPRPRQHRRVAGIDRNLADVIDRCLAVNPAKRYANAQAVLNALDVRALRRARRPLLVLGALGPVLLLLLMGFLVRSELDTAVQKSTDALIESTRVSNEFAAQAVAAKVAGKIDRRWRLLEQEAAGRGFQKLVKDARGSTLGTAPQQAVQARLDAMFRAHAEVASDGWAVFDDLGTLLARSPCDERISRQFIGRRFAHRNYFYGGDTDLDESLPALPPLTHAHRSNVFESKMTKTRKVAFAVPVWDGKPDAADGPRLGVLMMTVEVGGFAELRGDGNDGQCMAVLVDLRADTQGRRGAILEHPRLAELRRQKVPEADLQFFVDPASLAHGSWEANYTDPVGAANPAYQGRWLAACSPVVIDERPTARTTDWVVVVQERHNVAIEPVLQLQRDMVARGRWALGLAVAVVTALWLFVILVLNESAGARLFAYLRRRAGLSSDSIMSTKGATSPQQAGRSGIPTVTEPSK